MSHRKFEAPRHGSLGFLPRKRCRRHQGKIKAFPKDVKAEKPHLTAFMGYKAGMTHIVREVNKPGSKIHKKEVVEGVTIIETPPMIVVGLVGYQRTMKGLRNYKTVWAQHLSSSMRRRMYSNWGGSNKKAFYTASKSYMSNKNIQKRAVAYQKIMKKCDVVRVIAHTQINKIRINTRKAHIMEIQINGGSVADKVNFGKSLFEVPVPIKNVFAKDQMIDVLGITKGHGTKGVVSRWGVTKLPRKTHKGLRKVACIGAWHPSRVMWTVARVGQKGYHHRCERNKKIYRVGDSSLTKEGKFNASTVADLTKKEITPMGGFPHYGPVRNEYIMLKGSITGPRKRVITLRQSLFAQTSRNAEEEITLKFIDTSSKSGIGKFQTADEKLKVMGIQKRHYGDKEVLNRYKKLARK